MADGSVSQSVNIWNIKTQSWSTGPDITSDGLFYAMAPVVGTRIYLLGGFSDVSGQWAISSFGNVRSSNAPANTAWGNAVTSGTFTRRRQPVFTVLLGNMILMAGGQLTDDRVTFVSTTDWFNTSNNQWWVFFFVRYYGGG